jgi:hypothetical protein
VDARRTAFPKAQVKDGDGEKLKQATLRITSRVSVSPDWRLVTRSQVTVSADNRVHIPFLNIDITTDMMGLAEKAIDKALKTKVDTTIATSTALADRVARLWTLLAKPYAISDGVWGVVNPEGLGIDAIAGENDTLHIRCHLIAHPGIVMGPTPTMPAHPLPPNTTQPNVAPGFHLALQGRIPLATANAMLRDLLFKDQSKPLEFTVQHHPLHITDITISGSGSTMLFTLHFTGYFHGVAYLIGTIHYDPKAHTLYVTDVDYSLDTKNLLAQVASDLFYEKIKKEITRAAVWSIDDDISRGKNRIESALNATLTNGVQLQGTISNLQPLGVYIDNTTISALLQVDGEARMTIPDPRPLLMTF